MDLEEESDVGIGVVYEQFMLNRLLKRIAAEFKIRKVLEAPVFGMAGLTGINSMVLPELGIDVTIGDSDKNRLAKAEGAWSLAGRKARFVFSQNTDKMPLADSEFDLVYNFAALWHVENPEGTLREMARLSSNAILVCMPNTWNPMFQLRKIAGKLPKNASWTDINKIKKVLNQEGFVPVEQGIIDIPPWPDIVVPLKNMLSWLNMEKGKAWRWSMLDYYSGKNPRVKDKALRYSFLEDSALPVQIKIFWAHHGYLVAKRHQDPSP